MVGPSRIDRLIEALSPSWGRARAEDRLVLAHLRDGYDASNPSRKRRFHRNILSGEQLARASAVELRNQARFLERNMDIASGILDKLVDFSIGPTGIMVEPQPKRHDGSVDDDFAEELERDYAAWSEWPEVTWTHDRASMERLAARTWYRDGEVLGQLVTGPRADLIYGSDVPMAIELIEPDMLPMDLEDLSINLRQAIERNAWGRARRYHVLTEHPGDAMRWAGGNTKSIPAERMLHVRLINRIGQLRGITQFASIITTLQDIQEYLDNEQLAAKLASSLVFKITQGGPATGDKFDADNPPLYRVDGGMMMVNGPGQDAELFDTKRPNVNAIPFVEARLRGTSAGAGLSYSAVSRNYNGTYSAQRQELVENWPHHHAMTGMFVAQWSRPGYQEFCRWRALTKGVPARINPVTISDALYFGPSMPWINPVHEAQGQILMVQARFKSSAAVMRERGNSLRDTYRQAELERKARERYGILSTELDELPAGQRAMPGESDAEKLRQREMDALEAAMEMLGGGDGRG